MTRRTKPPSGRSGKLGENKMFWVILVAIALRIPYLNQSIWFDEYLSTHDNLSTFAELVRVVEVESTPPLYYLLMFFWNSVFGDSQVSIRVPSFVFGICSVYLVYLLARLYVGRSHATVVALLLAASPVHIWYSQEARNYSLFVFFTLSAVYCFERLYFDPEPGKLRPTLYGVSVLCLINTHFYGGIVIVAMMLVVVFREAGNPRVRPVMILAHLPVLAAIGAFLWTKRFYFFSKEDFLNHLANFTLFEGWKLLLNWLPFGNVYGGARNWATVGDQPLLFLCQLALLAVLIRGVLFFLKDDRARHVPAYLFTAPLIFILIYYQPFVDVKRNWFIERAFVNLLPFFFIVLVRGLVTRRGPSGFVAPAAVLFSIVTLSAFFTKSDQWTVYKPKPDWQRLGAYLEETERARAQPVLVFAMAPSQTLFYYSDLPQLRPFGELRTLPVRSALLSGEIDHFYVVNNRFWGHHSRVVIETRLRSSGFSITEHVEFKALDLYQVVLYRPTVG